MFNKNRPEKIRETKLKINVDLGYVKKIIFAIGIFILIDSIFLFINVGTMSSGALDDLVAKGYTRETARVLSMFTLYGAYILDWAIMIILLISLMIGRSRMEYGNLFNYSWMFLVLIIALFPFASPTATPMMLVKTGVLVAPSLFIIYILFLQTNDLKWARKTLKAKERRGSYV